MSFRIVAKMRLLASSYPPLLSVRLYVLPHVSARRPLCGFPWNLVLATFMKVCRENPYLLEADKNMGILHAIPSIVLFYWCLRHIFAIEPYCATLNIVMLLTVTCSSATHRDRCVATVTMVTGTGRNITLRFVAYLVTLDQWFPKCAPWSHGIGNPFQEDPWVHFFSGYFEVLFSFD
jgi:hypothetical protein